MQQVWTTIRNKAIANYGIDGEGGSEQWDRLGPLSEGTQALARNRGAAERRRGKRVEDSRTQPETRPNESHNDEGHQDKQEEEAEEEDLEGLM